MWPRSIPRPDRVKKRRRALGDAVDLPWSQSDESSTSVRSSDWQPGSCRPGLCGQEAACRQFHNNTYICVCPHDLSQPTSDFKCPNRLTVPLTPSPIHNIILPGGANTSSNSTAPTTARPTAITLTEQAVLSTRDDFLPAWSGLLIGILAVTVTMILVSIVVCLWKRKELAKCVSRADKSRKPSSSTTPQRLKKALLEADRLQNNPEYQCTCPLSVSILERERFCFLQEIGEGCFGKVYKGEFRKTEELTDIVAVKVLKETATRETEEDFMREVDIMSNFKHENILRLIGVVLRDPGSSPWMVFEFMPHGDLAEVLRSNSPQLWKPMSGLISLTKESLLYVALQIAAGMCYLASQRFVHRDLACRNCLVGVDLVVKIADFGMSRDVYTCDYYKIGGSRLLPVRWMSPESITHGRFTLESDIWSYGVILWEIYSLGKQPYYGHSNDEAVTLILQGIMLIPPEDCPTLICDLMRSCWKTNPNDRGNFTAIHKRLEKAGREAANLPSTSLPPRIPPNPPPHKALSMPRGGLPRPPTNFPGAEFSSDQDLELLDPDNYLLPQIPPASRCEYMQPLPD